jgi:hypothetical protein
MKPTSEEVINEMSKILDATPKKNKWIYDTKRKARELVDKFRLNVVDYEGSGLNDFKAKQCALIAVNEIINSNPHSNPMNTYGFSTMQYWYELKQEIEKL